MYLYALTRQPDNALNKILARIIRITEYYYLAALRLGKKKRISTDDQISARLNVGCIEAPRTIKGWATKYRTGSAMADAITRNLTNSFTFSMNEDRSILSIILL